MIIIIAITTVITITIVATTTAIEAASETAFTETAVVEAASKGTAEKKKVIKTIRDRKTNIRTAETTKENFAAINILPSFILQLIATDLESETL